MNTFFPEIKKNFGFGCMRLPVKDDGVDYEEFSKMIDTFIANGFNYFDTAVFYMDGKSEKQLAFDNVLVLQTEVKNYQGTVLVEIDWKGGTGYYATNGTVREIVWSKKDEKSPIKLFDAEGNPISINTGKTYIGVGASEVEIPVAEASTTAAQ